MRLEREHGPAAGADDPDVIYDERYYRAGLGPFPYQRDERWLGFFGVVADNLVRIFAPNTAFDVGCAMGMLVESLWDRGVVAQGIDVSAYALSCVRPDMRAHCRFGSIVEAVDGRFDIVTCIEVLEHLPPEATGSAVANLCRLSDTIVFSSSPGDFAEPTHINVRAPLEWIRLFARHGLRADLTTDASFIAPHAIVFRRAERYDDGEIEAFVARHGALRVTLAARDKELAERPVQLETARAETAAASKREAALAAELRAAQTERDAALARVPRSEREQARLRAQLAAVRRELASLDQSLRSERDRSTRADDRAAELADEIDRLQNLRLLDDMRRTGEAAELSRLRALEQRYARLSEAYADRSG